MDEGQCIILWASAILTYDFLFQCKNVMVEKFVQLFVSVVDAQLLKWIKMEVLEAKNVQNSNKARGIFARIGTFVDVIDKPSKCSGIQSFAHGMSIFFSLIKFERDFSDVAANVDLSD